MSKTLAESRKIWTERIHQWEGSKKSLTQWARENNFPYSQVLYWKTKILGSSKQAQSSNFIELHDAQVDNSGIFIEINHLKIHLSKFFDEKTLKKCLNSIRGE